MFRKNHVTLTGTGYYDLLGLHMGSILVGISHQVDKVTFTC